MWNEPYTLTPEIALGGCITRPTTCPAPCCVACLPLPLPLTCVPRTCVLSLGTWCLGALEGSTQWTLYALAAEPDVENLMRVPSSAPMGVNSEKKYMAQGPMCYTYKVLFDEEVKQLCENGSGGNLNLNLHDVPPDPKNTCRDTLRPQITGALKRLCLFCTVGSNQYQSTKHSAYHQIPKP